MTDKTTAHHSRVSSLMIDCLADRFDKSLEFWTRALGLSPPRRPTDDQRYVTLGRIEGPLFVRLQKVEHDPGYHLDIESDRIGAEADRLEAAGARRKYHIKRWWVLEDPSGNAFCVIRPESDTFPDNANLWVTAS
ncbi:MAG TPA: VOC family protein [Woeseiaceae bacterium]|nr:VOC family protein [Woeseiaceae bacterium]